MANHVVNSLNFEIKVATQSNFDELSEEIPELVKTSLAELIDQILSELYPSHHLLVIDKLEIDLGSLRLSNLKADLTQKFKVEFRAAFKQQLESSFPQVISAEELPFIVLDDFILRGTRPKWLSTSEASFQNHIAKAFSKNPKNFSKKLSGYLRNPYSKKRVLENFSEEVLMQSALVEHPIKSIIPPTEITRLKDFFRQQYRHLDANSASKLFKGILVDVLIHPQKINSLSGFRSAVADSMENRLGSGIVASYQASVVGGGQASERLVGGTQEALGNIQSQQPLSLLEEVRVGLLQKFQFFMFHGYALADNRSATYRYRNLNVLFQTLLTNDFESLVAFLLTYGKSAAIKRRFLDSLSQEAILAFFSKVAPEKRRLLDWVIQVVEQVQEEYQPINQTLIQVKKSINEITFELFLTKNLQSISDENYLRLLFKKTAQKFGISYKNLLFLTLKSIAAGDKKYRVVNFNQTLSGLYGKDILKRNDFKVGDWILFSTEEKEQVWRANSQSKEELVAVFASLYKEQHQTVPTSVLDWLRAKVQRVSLSNTSALVDLWKEFAKKHKLSDKKLNFSRLLESKDFQAGALILFSKQEKEQKGKANYKNREELISLFTSLYRHHVGAVPSQVSVWLRTRLESISVDRSTTIFELWEEFAQENSLPVGDLLIPLLLENTSNASITLGAAEFTFWLKKYGIQGIYHSKPADTLLLLSFLQSRKKIISVGLAKKIAAGLPISAANSKQAFALVAELIRPSLATGIPGFVGWIQELLKKNKTSSMEAKVFTWLYHQLIVLPQNQLTLPSLQEKVTYFLKLNEEEPSQSDSKVLGTVSKKISLQNKRQGNGTSKMVARLFDLLGTKEVYGIFPEAKRYEEEILLKLLTTKYAKAFYQLLDTHRFNPEFQDALLVQAPNWLKKHVLDFLLQRSSFDWNATLTSIKLYLGETKWIKLEGASLESFVEKILWREVFDTSPLVWEGLVLELLNLAMDSRLLTAKFYKDLRSFVQASGQEKVGTNSISLLQLSKLENLEGFAYLLSRSGNQKVEAFISPIFESLVYDSVFPVAHTFEGISAVEFSEYITRLVVDNKNEFFTFFSQVRLPFLSRRFFNLLEYKGLLAVMKEKHKREGLAISVAQVERLLKIFGLQEQGKVIVFLRAWLVYLFHSPTGQRSAAFLVGEVGTLLAEEGLLDTRKLDLGARFTSFFSLFRWTEAEKNQFLKLGQAWVRESDTADPIFVWADEEQILAYFKEGQDRYVKNFKGAAFFTSWLELFFDLAPAPIFTSFVSLFKSSFYENRYETPKKIELFLQRFFQLKEGYASYLEASRSNPILWTEFRKNSPKLFEQLGQETVEMPKQMSLLDLLQFYLAYGVLPKEEGSLQDFVKRLMKIGSAHLTQVRRLFLASLADSKRKKHVLKLLRYVDEKWFYTLLHPKFAVTLDTLVEEVRKKTGSNFYADLRIQHAVDRILFFAETLSRYGSPSKHVAELLLPVFEEWMETKNAATLASLFIEKDTKSEVLLLIQHSSRKVKKILEEELEKKEEESPIPEPEEVDFGVGISVYNAGMVLCWPFFGRFLAALNLVEQGKFKGQQAEERGVQLLQYLATGLTSFEEWDLSLNKVLCGVPLNTPISPRIELTLEEEELVKKLINGTIFNWEKMRGTRLETFRETFLMREGILYEKDNRWELIVERKAYDVLMETMNWNISMINLGWMKKRLNVQWK